MLAEILVKENANLRLDELLHDWEIKTIPIALDNGSVVRAKPDGYLDFWVRRKTGWKRRTILLEVDNGTERKTAFCAAVAARLRLLASSCAQLRFEPASTTLVYVAVPGQARAAELLSWIEEALVCRGAQDKQYLFRVTGADAASLSPHDFWLEPNFYQPDPHRTNLPKGFEGRRPMPLLRPLE